MSPQNCMRYQNWDKTFELQNTTVMSGPLDCQIMNIYCIMKMWWHLEQSHLTLSSCASVSPLSTNAFCSKGCILKDSGRNVSQSRHCLIAGVISDWFLNSGEHTNTRVLYPSLPPIPFFLFHSVSAPFPFKHFLLVYPCPCDCVGGSKDALQHEREAWPVGRCLPPHYQMQMKRVHMFNI